MALSVDPEQRRQQVAEAAADLIAKGGVSAVTFRNLAEVLDCSTTGISHYFGNRQAILIETYHFVAKRAFHRRAPPEEGDAASLWSSLEEVLPLSDAQVRDWTVWLCFWTEAVFDPVLAAVQKHYSLYRRHVLEGLFRTHGYEKAAAELAQTAMTALYGIAVQAVFDPETWTEEKQRRELREALARVRSD